MCSQPVTLGGGITMVKGFASSPLGTAGLEGAGVLPDQGHAAFDVGGLVVLLDHDVQSAMVGGLKSRHGAPSQHGSRFENANYSGSNGTFGADMGVPASRPLAAARNPLDFGLDDALHQPRQIVVEPGFQHRAQHLLDEVLQRPCVVAEHGVGERVEGELDGRDRRRRQDLASAVAAVRPRPAAARRPAAAASISTPPIPRTPDRPRARPSGMRSGRWRLEPRPPCRRSTPAPRHRPAAGAPLPRSWSRRDRSAAHRCRPGCCSQPGAARAVRRYRFCGGGRRRNLRRRNVGHRRRLGGRRTRR